MATGLFLIAGFFLIVAMAHAWIVWPDGPKDVAVVVAMWLCSAALFGFGGIMLSGTGL